MEATFLLIAQVSSAITSLLGLWAIYLTIKAGNGLLDGEFKTLVRIASAFLIIVIIGIVSMTFYHILNGTETAEKLELIWYIFIYLSLLFSLYESYKVIKFGELINKTPFKKKK